MTYYAHHAEPSLELVTLRKVNYHPTLDQGGRHELFYDGGGGAIQVLSVHASREAAQAAIPRWLEEHPRALAAQIRSRPENSCCDIFGVDVALEERRRRYSRGLRSHMRAIERNRRQRRGLLSGD